MEAWWIIFSDGKTSRCFEGARDDVLARAQAIGAVASIAVLPYPADPREAPMSQCPSFCYSPAKCAGRTACPKSYACSE